MSPEAGLAAARVLRSGYVGQGDVVERFEAALQRALDAPVPPLTVNNCTSALDLALHLIGVSPGDEVISTPMTCTATNTVIVRRGAAIVWADVDPVSGLVDPADVARKITAKTRAVMAVDWAGRACDYPALRALGVPVVEDAAHAYLAKRNGASIARAGGDYVCWSFQAIKHLTCGDGGALLAPPEQMERGRLLRWYGLDRRSDKSFRCAQNITEAGYKYHMNDIAASVGLANLPVAADAVARHRANAAYYRGAICERPGICLPTPDPGSAWWLYTLLVDERERFMAYLADRGVESSPVHARNDRHDAFRFPNGPLPGVDSFAGREVAIPVGWWLTGEDRAYVARCVNDFSASR